MVVILCKSVSMYKARWKVKWKSHIEIQIDDVKMTFVWVQANFANKGSCKWCYFAESILWQCEKTVPVRQSNQGVRMLRGKDWWLKKWNNNNKTTLKSQESVGWKLIPSDRKAEIWKETF